MGGAIGNTMGAVNQYKLPGTAEALSMFGGDQGGWQNMLNGQGQGQGSNLFGQNGFGLEQLGQMGGIAGGLFGMYNQYQTMQNAKNMLNNQTKTGNYNMANNTNFTNATIDAFGSGQAQSKNQFGSMS